MRPNLQENSATGLARIPAGVGMFRDHFAGMPILPASFCLEISAQIAGPLAELQYREKFKCEKYAFLSMVRTMKVHRPVNLPASLDIYASIRRLEPSYTLCFVEVKEKNQLALNAQIVFSFFDVKGDTQGDVQDGVLGGIEDFWKPAIEQRNKRLQRWMGITP